jgi:hypothetical protein
MVFYCDKQISAFVDQDDNELQCIQERFFGGLLLTPLLLFICFSSVFSVCEFSLQNKECKGIKMQCFIAYSHFCASINRRNLD